MPEMITVKKGDCFINLCKQAGFFWEIVWNHPENQKLREKRKKLNILKKGDRVYMSDRELKKVSEPTEQEHVFLLKGTPVMFALTLLNLGEPRADEDYILTIDGEKSRRGRIDETGTLKARKLLLE